MRLSEAAENRKRRGATSEAARGETGTARADVPGDAGSGRPVR